SQKKNGSAFSLKIFINSAFLRVPRPSVFQVLERTHKKENNYHCIEDINLVVLPQIRAIKQTCQRITIQSDLPINRPDN
ncbi:hypothetical protein, partial [Escherichia coli]|uniref:hypothetical protein n=1 Tax=Escherichia coli TaxID=562 RepID=UPI0021572FBB